MLIQCFWCARYHVRCCAVSPEEKVPVLVEFTWLGRVRRESRGNYVNK